MICDHVAYFMQHQGYGTIGTDLWVGIFNEVSPANATCWRVMSVEGLPCDLSIAYNHDHEYVEIAVRGVGSVVKPKLTALRDKLLGYDGSELHPSTPIATYPVPSPVLYLISPHGPLSEEYRDAKNRTIYSFRIKVEYGLLSSEREDY